MTTKAYRHLYDLADDESLGRFLANYHWASTDSALSLSLSKTEAIAEFLLYFHRKEFTPTLHCTDIFEEYVRIDYDRLREDVKRLIEKLSDREWSWINKNLTTSDTSINQLFVRNNDVAEVLKSRKEFRHDLDMLRAFRETS